MCTQLNSSSFHISTGIWPSTFMVKLIQWISELIEKAALTFELYKNSKHCAQDTNPFSSIGLLMPWILLHIHWILLFITRPYLTLIPRKIPKGEHCHRRLWRFSNLTIFAGNLLHVFSATKAFAVQLWKSESMPWKSKQS